MAFYTLSTTTLCSFAMSGVKLRRVNHDTSWLITFPTSSDYATSTFNLLIDPWLDDSEQIDYHSTFSEQKRTSPALATSIQELEDLLREETKNDAILDDEKRLVSKQIDAILISHPFTDHMHPGTLLDENVPSRIPFIVSQDAKSALESLLGERKKTLIDLGKSKLFVLDKAQHEITPEILLETNIVKKKKGKEYLPSNVEILQITSQERFSIFSGAASIAWSKLHGGILFLWKKAIHRDEIYHSLIYSPHGIGTASIPTWLHAPSPNIHHEAILTSLDRITLPKWLSGIVNLGLSSATDLIVKEVYQAKRILATHEERKEAKGMVASLIKRYWLGLSTPDARNDGLTELKQKDANRQMEAQNIVNATLQHKKAKAQVLVLDINDPLLL